MRTWSPNWFRSALLAATAGGCTEQPPPRWLEGGARLRMADAHWVRDDQSRVEIRTNGEVWIDGAHTYGLDRVGRLVDAENDPIAMLQPDGSLRGLNGADLGSVDWSEATPPAQGRAWLGLMRDGRVYYLDEDGERSWDGRWAGCDGAVQRTCTLVTHFLRTLTEQGSLLRSTTGSTFQQ